MVAKVFTTPFAKDGNRTAVPDAMNPFGFLSYNEGFGPDYAREIGVDPLAKDIPRENWNAVMFDVTTALQEMQSGAGVSPFDPLISLAIGGYPKGALVPRADGNGFWLSTINDNTSDPEVIGSSWYPINVQGVFVQTLGAANVVLSTSNAAHPVMVIAGVLAANVTITVPAWSGNSWTIDDRTTGNFTVTIKTPTGAGAVTRQGLNMEVYCYGVDILVHSSADTAAQFNATKRAASTAFVQRALGNVSAAATGAARTLVAADAGKAQGVTGNGTITLPLISAVSDGATFHLQAEVASGVSYVGRSGSDLFILAGATSGDPIPMYPGETLSVAARTSDSRWVIIGGSAASSASVPVALAPQFDNSSKDASTAFVQRALGNFASVNASYATRTLVAADAGKLQGINASQVITLPLANSVPAGAAFNIFAIFPAGTASILRQSSDVISWGGVDSISAVLNVSDSVVVASDGVGAWSVVGGSATKVTALANQFDDSTKASSTAFIRRALGNNSGVVRSLSRVLTAADAGSVSIMDQPLQSFTLPLASAVQPGTVVNVWNCSTGNGTVLGQASEMIFIGNDSAASVPIPSGGSITLVSETSSWAAIDGSVTMGRAGVVGNANGSASGASRTLTAKDAGEMQLITTAASTVTVPVGSTLNDGAMFRFTNASAGNGTVAVQGADQIFVANVVYTTLPCNSGETLSLMWNGTYWYAVDGLSTVSKTALFTSLQDDNGYQKIPGGIIIQWGLSATTSGDDGTITFPIAFPTNCFAVTLTTRNVGGDGRAWIYTEIPTLTDVEIRGRWEGGSASPQDVYWFAIGN